MLASGNGAVGYAHITDRPAFFLLWEACERVLCLCEKILIGVWGYSLKFHEASRLWSETGGWYIKYLCVEALNNV